MHFFHRCRCYLLLFTFKLLHFDKLYCNVFEDAPRISCHFTVLQEFKTQVINCLDGQAV